jgi:hypothetical protein
MRQPTVFVLLLTAILTISCGEFRQNTASVKLRNEVFSASESLYLRVNITNPGKKNIIYFTARFSNAFIMTSLPLSVLYISPEGKRYSDTVTLYLNQYDKNTEFVRNGNWRDYRWLYRNGVIFPEKGVWLISVKNTHIKNVYGVKELGISLKQNR